MKEIREIQFAKLDVPSPEAATEEIALVRATGEAFGSTNEPKVLNCEEAMEETGECKAKIEEAWDTEHNEFLKH